VCTAFDKLLQPEAIFLLKLHKKAFSYQAPPGTVRGVFTAPPDLPVRLRGLLWTGIEGRAGKGQNEERGRIIALPPISGSATASNININTGIIIMVQIV